MRTECLFEARRPIAVVLSRFPVITETFILREIIEMERQGQPVRLVPLLRESPSVVHPEAKPWIQRALYTPFLSLPILLSNLRAAWSRPALYFGMILRLVLSSLLHPRFLIGTLGIFPKSVHLAARLEEEEIHHVHCHFGSHPATAAWIISIFSNATFSVTVHAHDLFVPRYTPFLGPKLEAASFVRVISEFNKRFLVDRYPEVNQDRVRVVHVGIPVADYEPGRDDEPEGEGADVAGPDATGGDPKVTRILSVAGLRAYKGLSVLVDACRRLGEEGFEFQCSIVGEGPLRDALELQIQEAGLNDRVHLAGAMKQGQVTEQLRGGPIFALPSVVQPDGMMDGIPVALMEAMAAEAPVVASRISGIPELIENDESGILVDPGDSSGLADAIRRISRDPDLARSLSKTGARKVREQFSLDVCTGHLLALIDRVNEPLIDRLPRAAVWEDHLQSPGSDGPGRGRPHFGVRMLQDGRDSRVVEVLPTNHGTSGSIVVKVHADRPGQSRPARERARHEYEVMDFLASAWPGQGGGKGGLAPVPRPIGLDQSVGLLVMEPSRGCRLDSLLRTARRRGSPSLDVAEAAMERTGAWLKDFQGLAVMAADPEEGVELWRSELRRNFEGAAGILSVTVEERAESAVTFYRSETAARSYVPSGHHGDFWPGNVMTSPEGVQVLDFEGYRPGLIHEDPAYFLLQAELFFDYPLLRRRFEPMRSAFLRGYGQRDLTTLEGYRACRMSVCLRLLAREAGIPDSSPARRRRVRRLLAALDEVV